MRLASPRRRPIPASWPSSIGAASARSADGLDAGAAQGDVIVFLDDDFAPSLFWFERVEALFAARGEIVCVNGHVLADGAKAAGVAPLEAWAIVAEMDARDPHEDGFEIDAGPFGYGCDVAFCGATIRDERFDERLPGYGWLEDRDFAARAALVFAVASRACGACIWDRSPAGHRACG